MAAPKFRIYVPTRGYVFCETANTLARLANRAGVPLPHYMRGNASVSDVRNRIVQHFLGTDGEVLIMCDDDVVPPDHTLHNLQEALRDYPIVSGVCLIVRPGTFHLPNVFSRTKEGWGINHAVFGQTGLVETDGVGTGLIAIHREVLENKYIRAPFGSTYDRNGVMTFGEDLSFCRRVASQGYKIAVDMDIFCEHHVAVHANAIAQAYLGQIEQLLAAQEVNDVEAPDPLLEDG